MIESQSLAGATSYVSPNLTNQVSENWMTEVAVAYQVLSAEHTSFICVIQENDEQRKEAPVEHYSSKFQEK